MRAVVLIMSLLLAGAAYAQNQAPTAEQPKNVLQPAAPSAPSTEPTAAPAESSTTAESVAPTDADEEKATPLNNHGLTPGIVTAAALSYYGRELKDSSATNGKFNSLSAEIRGGYVLDFGLFAGLTGHYDTGKSGSDTITTYFVGPTVGYSCDITGLFFTATYHLIGQSDMDSIGKYKKINGLQVDVGYPMMITEQLKFGPQITYRDVKMSDGDTLADQRAKQVVPYLGLWFIF